MTMEYQDFVNAALGISATVIGWFARTLWEAVTTLKDDLYKLKEEIAKDYVPKDEFVIFKSELFTVLRRIEDKLERKQDK